MEGLSAKDSLPILNYKGSEALEASLQSLMKEKKFWKRMVDFTNSTAGSAKELFPQLKKAMDESTAALNGGCRPEVWLATLAEILPILCKLRKGLKPRATLDLEAVLLQMIPSTCKFITSSKTADEIDTDQVAIFSDNLDLFGQKEMEGLPTDDPAVEAAALSDLRQKLGLWQSNMARSIGDKKLDTIITKWISAAESSDGAHAKVTEGDWNEFAKQIMTTDKFPESLQKKASLAISILIGDLHQKAELNGLQQCVVDVAFTPVYFECRFES